MSILHHAIPNDPYYNDVVLHLRGYDAQSGQVFKDYSKYNRQINVYGNTSHSTTQKKYGNSSIYFDGSGDYLTVPASSDFAFGTGGFTFELWFYKTQNSPAQSYNRIFQLVGGDIWSGFSLVDGSTSQNEMSFWSSSSGSSFNIVNGTSLGILDLNQWYHIAIVRNGINFNGYINSNPIYLGTSSASLYYNNTMPVICGQSGGRYITGYIEDLRITKGIARPIAIPTQPFPNF